MYQTGSHACQTPRKHGVARVSLLKQLGHRKLPRTHQEPRKNHKKLRKTFSDPVEHIDHPNAIFYQLFCLPEAAMDQETSTDIWPVFTTTQPEAQPEVTPKQPLWIPSARPPLEIIAYHASNGSPIVRQARLLSPQNIIMLFAIICLSGIDAHNMTACMCKRPQFLGAIEINRFGACNLPDLQGQVQEVQYSLFSLRKQHHVQGYACRFWRNVVTVDCFGPAP